MEGNRQLLSLDDSVTSCTAWVLDDSIRIGSLTRVGKWA